MYCEAPVMNNMGICIGRLALSQDFSDVRMVVGQEQEIFPAHKVILAARSEYFRKMLYGAQMKESKESICSFPDDDPSVFKTMLYHLYERPLEFVLDPRHITLCLMTSEKYRIETFRNFCLKALEDLLSVSTVCEIASLLEDLSDTPLNSLVQSLTDKCETYLFAHLEEIINAGTHLSLSCTLLERVLQHPFVTCSEISLFNAIAAWHMHHNESYLTNRDSLLKMLSYIDLRLIKLDDMVACVHPSGIFDHKELAELYKTRIKLQHFGHSIRSTRRCAVMFHAGAEYMSRPNDVLRSLKDAGMDIDPADVLNFAETPTENAHKLMEYSAVLVFSMETRSKGLCGDLLADYVDRGGCIVMCHALGCISGKIMTEKYLPVKRVPPLEGEFKAYQLGNVLVHKHPLFKGVHRLKVKCAPNFVWNCSAVGGKDTKILSEWDDGTIMACERNVGMGRILFLNLYPVSTRVVLVGLDKDCDGHIFLRNALLYAGYKPSTW